MTHEAEHEAEVPDPRGRLLDRQKHFRELGRLRTGQQVETQSGKKRPAKLSTWRLTSPSRLLLEQVAGVYGGEVEPWEDAPQEGENWQVVTTSDTLRVLIPPGNALTQYYELWSGGGCRKRCDGVNQILADRKCSCPADINKRIEEATKGKACTPTSRLAVMLYEIDDIGVWRLETRSYNAADEMRGTYDLLKGASGMAATIGPVRLRIDHRSKRVEGKPTSRFTVPVLEVPARVGEIAAQLKQLVVGEEPQERPALGPAVVQRRSLPGEPPPVSTDPGGLPRSPAEGRPPAPEEPPVSEPIEPKLPQWILDLPGDDGDILEEATAESAARGKGVVYRSLTVLAADVAQAPDPGEVEEAIRRRVEERVGPVGEPVQEGMRI